MTSLWNVLILIHIVLGYFSNCKINLYTPPPPPAQDSNRSAEALSRDCRERQFQCSSGHGLLCVPAYVSISYTCKGVGIQHYSCSDMQDAPECYPFGGDSVSEAVQYAGFALPIPALILAVVLWSVMWRKNRQQSSHRHVSIFVILVSFLAFPMAIRVNNAIPALSGACNLFPTLLFASGLAIQVLTSVHLGLCHLAARRGVTITKRILITSICSAFAFCIVITGLYYTVIYSINDTNEGRSKLFLLLTVPCLLAAFLNVVLSSMGIYQCAPLDTTIETSKRETRIFKSSSVCFFIMSLYMVPFYIVSIMHTFEIELEETGRVFENVDVVVYIMFESYGFVGALLLCFFDLEVQAMLPNHCTCLRLDETSADLEWLPLATKGA